MTYTVNARFIIKACDNFYRATLCVSAFFAVAWCLYVRLSVTFVFCIQTAENIVKLLSWSGSAIILVFLPQAPIPNYKGNPFIGGVKYTGWENLRFPTEIAVYLGNSTR